MPTRDDSLRVGDVLAPEIAELLDRRQLREAKAALIDLLDPEVAEVLEDLSPEHRVLAFRTLPVARQTEIFAHLLPDQQEQLLGELSREHLAAILNDMAPDDRTELFEELPDQLTARLLGLMRPEERRESQALLEYPEKSVGRFMTPDFVTLGADWTVQHALEHLREQAHDAETVSNLYVVDAAGRLLDEIRLPQLVLARPQQQVSELMDSQVVSLKATDDREEAVRGMERYDEPVLPVVDENRRLVGIVTFDDVADVAEEETTEDIHKLGGVAALDSQYTATRIAELVGKRAIWLAVLFVAGLLTISAMGRFQSAISAIPLLALFVPLIIASGGNSGSQAATLIIRALALEELKLSDWFYVLRRELLSGLLLGSLLAVLGFIVATGVARVVSPEDHATMAKAAYTGFAIGTAIVGVVVFGNLVGSMLPFLLKRIGLDPATSSTPFVATVVDVTGLLIYFSVVLKFLRHSPF